MRTVLFMKKSKSIFILHRFRIFIFPDIQGVYAKYLQKKTVYLSKVEKSSGILYMYIYMYV